MENISINFDSIFILTSAFEVKMHPTHLRHRAIYTAQSHYGEITVGLFLNNHISMKTNTIFVHLDTNNDVTIAYVMGSFLIVPTNRKRVIYNTTFHHHNC